MLHIHTILHATDFSTPSRNAFAVAYALARDYGARLILIHVRELALSAFGEYGMVAPPPGEDLTELHTKLRELAPVDAAMPFEFHVVEGEPAAQIVELAKEHAADLIVMGTHGRRGLERMLMGSVAEQVVRKAPCPVLTVKTPFSPEVLEESTIPEIESVAV